MAVDNASVSGVRIANDDDTVFAWQLGGGLSWSFTQNLTACLDYRWFATSDPQFKDTAGGSFKSEVSTHNFMLGLRYTF